MCQKKKSKCEKCSKRKLIKQIYLLSSESVLEVFCILFWRSQPILDIYTSFKLWITETVTSCTQMSGRQPWALCSVTAADLRLSLPLSHSPSLSLSLYSPSVSRPTVDGPPMLASRYIHMFPKQRDLMGFDEVANSSSSCFIINNTFIITIS